jgi:ribonuclease HII
MKNLPTFDLENEIQDNFCLSPLVDHNRELIIAGCDEAGRGPLCGPVIAAAVIFPSLNMEIPIKITDSKQMTAAQRDTAFDWLTNNSDILWATGQCTPAEIDKINILQASLLAMKRAIENLNTKPDFILVDGNRLPDILFSCPPTGGRDRVSYDPALDAGELETLGWGEYDAYNHIAPTKDALACCARKPSLSRPLSGAGKIPGRAIVKGDSKSLSIAAASIIAKVTRDRIMQKLAQEYPQYGWDKNAGYPTPAHLQAIQIYGINKHYRKTYGPVKRLLADSNCSFTE